MTLLYCAPSMSRPRSTEEAERRDPLRPAGGMGAGPAIAHGHFGRQPRKPLWISKIRVRGFRAQRSQVLSTGQGRLRGHKRNPHAAPPRASPLTCRKSAYLILTVTVRPETRVLSHEARTT